MARAWWSRRQAIIDGYLAETGANMFVPGEFVDWLKDRPDHEAYPWFYAKDDAAAAREYRIELARKMAAGLRITAHVEQPTDGRVVRIVERSYPAFISPVAGRRSGGGYQPVDAGNAAVMDEVRRQGLAALATWLDRYAGAFEAAGYDLTPIKEIAARKGGVVVAA